MKMNLQASLTWLVLLSAALLSQSASGTWLDSPAGQPWKKFSEWLKNTFKPKVPKGPQLRLVSERDRCAGRVEVYYKGKWATVCDDHFSLNSANVVCRQLDCGRAVSVLRGSHFGHGKGDIHLDNVQCRGTEAHLWDCRHSVWRRHNCGHHKVVSVICSDSSSAPSSSTPEAETPTAPGTLTTLEEVTSSVSTIVTEENAPSGSKIPVTVCKGSTDDSFTLAPATSPDEPSATVVSPSTASEDHTQLSQYVQELLLRYLNSLCRPTRPGIQSVRVQGCVKDPSCGNYYLPGQRIYRFKFRSPISPRVCLRCKVFMSNSSCYPFQRRQGSVARGKRSTDGSITVDIIPTQ